MGTIRMTTHCQGCLGTVPLSDDLVEAIRCAAGVPDAIASMTASFLYCKRCGRSTLWNEYNLYAGNNVRSHFRTGTGRKSKRGAHVTITEVNEDNTINIMTDDGFIYEKKIPRDWVLEVIRFHEGDIVEGFYRYIRRRYRRNCYNLEYK